MDDRMWEWDKRKVIPVWMASLVFCALVGRCSAPLPGQTEIDTYKDKIYRFSKLVRICKSGQELYIYDKSLWTRTKEFTWVFLPDGMTADQFCDKKE